MVLFNRRKKQTTAVPAEVQEYYQAERRERAGVAWLIGFATLLVTIALALGLFFGGRWVYRVIWGDDQPASPPISEQTPSSSDVQTDQNQTGESTTPPTAVEDQTDQPTSLPSGETPVSGDMPDTGPGSTLAIFVLASLAGMAAYQIWLRQNLSKN